MSPSRVNSVSLEAWTEPFRAHLELRDESPQSMVFRRTCEGHNFVCGLYEFSFANSAVPGASDNEARTIQLTLTLTVLR